MLSVTSLALLPFFHLAAPQKVLLQVNQDVNDRTEYQIKLEMEAKDKDGKVLGTVAGAMHIADRVIGRNAAQISYRMHHAASHFKATGVLESVAQSFDDLKGFDFDRTIKVDGTPLAASFAGGMTSSLDLHFSSMEVGVGDSWTSQFSPSGDIKLTSTFALVKMDDSEYTINATFEKHPSFELIEPYVFRVDRKTGRYKTCTGTIKVNTEMGSVVAKFNIRRLFPALPQFYGDK